MVIDPKALQYTYIVQCSVSRKPTSNYRTVLSTHDCKLAERTKMRTQWHNPSHRVRVIREVRMAQLVLIKKEVLQ